MTDFSAKICCAEKMNSVLGVFGQKTGGLGVRPVGVMPWPGATHGYGQQHKAGNR